MPPSGQTQQSRHRSSSQAEDEVLDPERRPDADHQVAQRHLILALILEQVGQVGGRSEEEVVVLGREAVERAQEGRRDRFGRGEVGRLVSGGGGGFGGLVGEGFGGRGGAVGDGDR